MKREILLHILKLTQDQSRALDEENIELFGQLMNEKQVAIEKLEALHQAQPETKEQKEEVLLKEIVALDQENNKRFMTQFEDVKKKLGDMRAQKRVNHVYSNPYDLSREEGIFFDKR